MKLIDFIVCDDIRQELFGKTTIVGVYSDLQIALPTDNIKWPILLKLGFFIRFKAEDGIDIPDNFEVKFLQEDNIFHSFQGNINIPSKSSYFNLIAVNNAFPIPKLGNISFQIVFKKDNKIINEITPDFTLAVNRVAAKHDGNTAPNKA
ncbi:MAG: DUF6941 family protein [bacterium]